MRPGSSLRTGDLTVALLAHDERRVIGDVVDGMRALGARVLVVDDGSTDGTAQKARRHGARVISHDVNLGYGAAVRTALTAARTPWVCVVDGDGQFPPEAVAALWAAREGADAVWGVRVHRADPWLRRIAGRAWQALAWLLTGVPVRDADCGAKLVRREALHGIDLRSRGAGVSVELALALASRGVRLREVAVPHLPRRSGRASGLRLDVAWRGVRELVQVAAVYGDGAGVARRLLRFALAGGANTLFDLGLFALAVAAWGSRLGTGEVALTAWLTYLAGGGLGWALGRTWTFPGRLAHGWRWVLWVAALGVLNGVLTGWLSLERGPTLAGKAVALVVTGAVSFVVQSEWVFVRKESAVRGGVVIPS